MTRGSTLVLALAALAGTSACKSASKAAHNTAEAMSSGYGAAMEAGRAVVDLLPAKQPVDPGEARERMLGQAGQQRFRNAELRAARDRLTPQASEFASRREQLRSERFEDSKDGFRNAEAPTFTGSLGKAMGVAVQSGLRVTRRATHPVLGGKFPGFDGPAPAPAQGRNRPD